MTTSALACSECSALGPAPDHALPSSGLTGSTGRRRRPGSCISTLAARNHPHSATKVHSAVSASSARWLNVGAYWPAVTQVSGKPPVTAESVRAPSTLPAMAAAGMRPRAGLACPRAKPEAVQHRHADHRVLRQVFQHRAPVDDEGAVVDRQPAQWISVGECHAQDAGHLAAVAVAPCDRGVEVGQPEQRDNQACEGAEQEHRRRRPDPGPPHPPRPAGWAGALVHRRAEQQRELRRIGDEHPEHQRPEAGRDRERRREKRDLGDHDEEHPRDAPAPSHAPGEERRGKSAEYMRLQSDGTGTGCGEDVRANGQRKQHVGHHHQARPARVAPQHPRPHLFPRPL